MQSNITDFLDRRHVIPGLTVHDKAGVLDELAQRAGVALKIEPNAIAAALRAREGLGSTGVGHGVAIPHANMEGLAQPFGIFVRIEPAVDFAAIDKQPVDLVFLLLTPARTAQGHLSALAAISRRLRDEKVARAVRTAPNAREIFAALTGETSPS